MEVACGTGPTVPRRTGIQRTGYPRPRATDVAGAVPGLQSFRMLWRWQVRPSEPSHLGYVKDAIFTCPPAPRAARLSRGRINNDRLKVLVDRERSPASSSLLRGENDGFLSLELFVVQDSLCVKFGQALKPSDDIDCWCCC